MADLNEFLDSLPSSGQSSLSKAPTKELSSGEFFVKNIFSSAGEMFGMEPSDAIVQARAEHPNVNLASSLVGTAIPYAGWGKFAKLGKYGEYIADIGKGEDEYKFLTGAKKGLATFAPFEATRLATTALINPDKLPDTLVNAGVNLGIEAVGGGLLTKLSSAGKRKKEVLLGEDLKEAPQVRWRKLSKVKEEHDATPPPMNDVKAMEEWKKKSEALSNRIGSLEEGILDEDAFSLLKDGEKKIDFAEKFADGTPTDGFGDFLKRQVGKNAEFQSDKFTPTRRGLVRSIRRGDNLLEEAGLKGKLGYVQFPRVIKVNTDDVKKGWNFHELGSGSGLFWQKEAGENGLYVMAKKVSPEVEEGVVAKGGKLPETTAKGDRFVIWKTDKPYVFSPAAEKFAQKIDEGTAFLREPHYNKPTGGASEVWDEAMQLKQVFPHQEYTELANTGNVAKLSKYLGDKLGITEGTGEMAARLGEFSRAYLAPTMHQFKSSPTAKYIWGVARGTHEKSQGMARAMMFGEKILQGKNLYSQLLKGSVKGFAKNGMKPIEQIIDGMDEADLGKFLDIRNKGLNIDEAKEMWKNGEISSKLMESIQGIQNWDDYLTKQIHTTQEMAGVKKFKNLAGHYMIPHTWEGDLRVPIVNEYGEMVHVASGGSKAEVDKLAQQVVEELKAKTGHKYKTLHEAKTYDFDEDMALSAGIHTRSAEYMTAQGIANKIRTEKSRPKTFLKRSGVGGFKTDFTKQELKQLMYNHISHYQKYMADTTVNAQMQGELSQLAVSNPKMFNDVTTRLSQLAGKKGEIDKIQNKLVDSVMAPVLGKNSADKIVNAVNSYTYHMQLGMGNVGFPIQNMLSFLQTTLPRIAYFTSAAPESIARNAIFWPVNGKDGKVKGGMGVLDMMKLVKNSFKEMGNPSELLVKQIARAADEGVVTPTFAEEALGSNAKLVTDWKNILKEKDGYANWIKNASSYMATQSEKLGRGHTFTLGHMLFRDMYPNLPEEDLYRMAKEFTESTMFNYSVADRPMVMTGPAGRAFGLFKNWQAHYLASFLEYLGEGVGRGNWNPLLWQMGGTATVGGVSALPLYAAADQMSEWMTDDSLMTNIYEMFGKAGEGATGSMSDAVYLGLPSLLGISLSDQSSMPFNDPARDAGMLFSFVQWNRAKAIGQLAGEGIDRWQATGEHPIDSEKARNAFIKAFAPKSLAGAMSLTEDEGLKSLATGNKIVGNLNLAERMMISLGITPRQAAIAYDVNEEIWRNKEKRKAKVNEYGAIWQEAQERGDMKTLQYIGRKSMIEGIDISSILASANAQERNKKKAFAERQTRPEELMKFLETGLVRN